VFIPSSNKTNVGKKRFNMIDKRTFNRLKNYYFSLYEIEQELSEAQYPQKSTINVDEYDFLESLKSRQTDQIDKIKQLLDEYKNSEST